MVQYYKNILLFKGHLPMNLPISKNYHFKMTNFVKLSLVVSLLIISFHANVAHSKELVGTLLPEFELKNQAGELKTNKDYEGNWLILYFYPKDDTSGCTTEAKNFRDSLEKYTELNTKVVGVSLDDAKSHKSFSDKYQLSFDILADTEQKLAEAFNVVGGFGPVKYAKRETFIIDPDGNIVFHFKKVKPEEHSKNVLEKLKKIQNDLL